MSSRCNFKLTKLKFSNENFPINHKTLNSNNAQKITKKNDFNRKDKIILITWKYFSSQLSDICYIHQVLIQSADGLLHLGKWGNAANGHITNREAQ